LAVVAALLEAGVSANQPIDNIGTPAVHQVAATGDIGMMAVLLNAGGDVNLLAQFNGKDSYTPLHLAAVMQRTSDMAKLLLARGAAVDSVSSRNGSPLLLAAESGRTDMVRVLLAAGAQPDGVNDGAAGSPLWHAARHGHVDAVRALLAGGASPRGGKASHNPLMAAVAQGHVDVVTALLQGGSDANAIDDRGFSPLAGALMADQVGVAEVLVKHGASLTDNRLRQPIVVFAMMGSKLDTLRWAVAAGADVNSPNKDGDTPLSMAVEEKRPDLVSALIAGGANPSSRVKHGETLLSEAVMDGSLEVLKALVAGGADVNQRGVKFLPSECALAKRDADALRVLLQAGADPHTVMPDGMDLLSFAAGASSVDVLRVLLAAGADPNRILPSGASPLIITIASERVEALDALLAAGGRVNLRLSAGETPLHYAAANNLAVALAALLRHGADANAKTEEGLTPLLSAVLADSASCVKLLIDAGAETQLSGTSPLMIATGVGKLNAIRALVAAGSSVNGYDHGVTPLHLAAVLPNGVAAVCALADLGADVNAREVPYVSDGDKEGGDDTDDTGAVNATPLFVAAEYGRADTVAALLARGADPGLEVVGDDGVAIPILQAVCTGSKTNEAYAPDRSDATAATIRRLLTDALAPTSAPKAT